VAELVDAAPRRAVAVYAHPDDADVSCGGTLARWAAAGAHIHLVVCTQGEKGAADSPTDPAALAPRRRAEVGAAAAALGIAGHELLGYGDGEIENTADFRRRLVEIIRRERPDAVVCPDPTAVFFGQRYYNHRDHRVVGYATLDAVSPAAAQPLYFADTGPPHEVGTVYLSGTLEPDVWVDISATVEVKERALRCHASQLGGGGEWLRAVVLERAEEGGRAAGVVHAEGFRRIQLASPPRT
jgi:LmbE family N-acetylglucosaminyl deacetylase